MQVKAEIHKRYNETEIHVCSSKADEQVVRLITELSSYVNPGLIAQKANGDRVVLNEKDVFRFFAEGQKVFVQTDKETYTISKKLYELEEELNPSLFFRISKSEIINLKRIQKLDMSLSGTIRVIMKDGSETYTSRRNVVKLKKILGI